MSTVEAIQLAWAAFWVVVPFAAFPIMLVIFARMILRRSSNDGFAAEWIPVAADVALIEAALPKMKGAVL